MSWNSIKQITFGIAFLFMITLLYTNMVIDQPETHSTGLKPLTPEEFGKLTQRKISLVRPNAKALDRVNHERQKKGMPLLDSNIIEPGKPEFEIIDTSLGATSTTTSTNTTSTPTVGASPTTVDNSSLASFPPILSQGAQASCVAWAATYYQMSHQVCLVLGCDNKSSFNTVFSPRWSYNMINGGVDAGSSLSDAFNMQHLNGAASLVQLPYNTSDPRGWDLNPDDWKTAISYRTSAHSAILINSDTAIANAKQMLANGNVLTIGTYISSFQYRTIQDNPNTPEIEPYVGQYIVSYLNGSSGGHAMTIVGYDDSIWTDINGNGLVDSGELGAFKIANSWGAGWMNAGFVWASYDSFRATSTVSGFAPAGRTQLTQGGYAYAVTYSPHTLKAFAKVTATHLTRNQLNFQFATSSTATQTPQTYWSPGAFQYQGGAYAFDGSTTAVQSTFIFDLSDLVTTGVDQQLFYLIAYDNVTGNELTVSSFEVIDPTVGNTLYSAPGIPLYVDGTSKRLIAGNYTPDLTAPSVPSSLTATLSSVRKGKRTITAVNLSWMASTDNVGVTGYRIYRNGVLLTSSTTTSYSDTNTSTGNTYTYQVSAIDAAGNESAKSNSAQISR